MKIFTVSTGFGYFLDKDNFVYCKAILPLGEHPLKDEFIYVEVNSKEELEAIEVYIKPLTSEQIKEQMIQNKIKDMTRDMAIAELQKEGKL